MKTDKKTLILTTLVCLIPIVAGALVYSRLPETIATLPFALKADPKHGNMSEALVKITIWTIPLVSLLCCGLTLARGLGYTVSVEFWVPIFMGVLSIVIGNYLPKTKQSYTMGIKLPWTLNSEENWNRTHRLAGYLWVLGGLLFIVMSFVGWSLAAFLIILAVMVLVPTAYSYLLYRKGI